MKIWYVYIVRCSDNSLYTGITNNIEKRIIKHNKGLGSNYTRSRLPLELVYKKKVGQLSDALKEEARIKLLSKKEKEVLIK